MVNQLPSPLQPASKILQKLASSLFMIVCAVDKEGRFVYINEASHSLLGYRPEELIGRSCYELMVEEEREDSYRATDAAFHGAPITTYENHFYHKDGRIITMLWEGKWDLGDELVYTTGRDVTEQRRLERMEKDYQATLQRTTHQMEDLVDRITDGFLGIDENARVIYWNKAAELISGLPQNSMVGNILWDVLPEPTCTLARQKLAEIKADKRPLHIEYFSERIERWMEVHAYISESGVSVFFRDVTERKELQEALIREKEERLREKEEEQKRITAAVIQATERERAQVGQELHDNVNQVLTAVKLYAGLCLDGVPQANDLLRKSISLLQQSIDEIRSLSKRLSAPSLGNIKLKDSLQELIDSVTITNQLAITFHADDLEDVSPTTHLALYRILQEQLTNVLKHAEAKNVSITLTKNETHLCLCVKDDGKGFDSQLKNNGIGLSNMASRAEALNGRIKFNSTPGEGCELYVELPL